MTPAELEALRRAHAALANDPEAQKLLPPLPPLPEPEDPDLVAVREAVAAALEKEGLPGAARNIRARYAKDGLFVAIGSSAYKAGRTAERAELLNENGWHLPSVNEGLRVARTAQATGDPALLDIVRRFNRETNQAPAPAANDWIPHKVGDPRPCAAEARVDLKFENQMLAAIDRPAGAWDWSAEAEPRIIAWRPAQ